MVAEKLIRLCDNGGDFDNTSEYQLLNIYSDNQFLKNHLEAETNVAKANEHNIRLVTTNFIL